MLQKVIDILYRHPKGRLKTYTRFGGYFAYRSLEKAHQQMEIASLGLPSVTSYSDGLPIYFLTGKKYIHQTLFCIQSLVIYAEEKFCFYLVDDGSFDDELIERLKTQLPNAVIILKNEIERYIIDQLPIDQFPILHRKRKEYPHIKKLTDVHLFQNGGKYKLVLDSDMLFWRKPDAIIEWLKNPEKPIHMVDCGEAYGYSHAILETLTRTKVPTLVNVGIIGLNSNTINWETVEYWIEQLEANYGKSYYLEQALSAMLIGDQSAKILPADLYVVNPVTTPSEEDKVTLQHYVDLSKSIYFNNAWKKFL